MILRKSSHRVIKLQQGGSMKIATPVSDKDLGTVPIDILTTAPKFNLGTVGSSRQAMPKTIRRPVAPKNPDYKIKGFQSDVNYVHSEVSRLRTDLIKLGSVPGGENSPAFRLKSEQLHNIVSQFDNVKTLETEFNKAIPQATVATGALAVYGNSAVVRNNKTGEVSVTDIKDALHADKGIPQYTIMTVGDAIQTRKLNMNFSGYTREGQELTQMLIHMEKKGAVDKNLQNAFKQSGFQAGLGTTLITPDGKESDAYQVLKLIQTGTSTVTDKTSFKNNKEALKAMYNGFNAAVSSDADMRSAIIARSIAYAKIRDPQFYNKSFEEQTKDIKEAKNSIIYNAMAAQLKTKYGDKFAVKHASEVKAHISNTDVALDQAGTVQPVYIGNSEYKYQNTVMYSRTTNLPLAIPILNSQSDKTHGEEISNLPNLQYLTDGTIANNLMTFNGHRVSQIVHDNFSNVVVNKLDGMQVLHNVPVIPNGFGGFKIAEDFMTKETLLQNEKKKQVRQAYVSLEKASTTAGKADDYKNKDHTFANLPGNMQTAIVANLEKNQNYIDIQKAIKSGQISLRNLVKFNVFLNVDNGYIPWLTPSTDADKYGITGHQDMFAPVKDAVFDDASGKDNLTTLAYNVYKTAVYMPLASRNTLNSSPFFKARTETSEQIARELAASQERINMQHGVNKEFLHNL